MCVCVCVRACVRACVRVCVHKNVSQILATIDFSSGEIARKTLLVQKSFTGNINLGQTVVRLGQT